MPKVIHISDQTTKNPEGISNAFGKSGHSDSQKQSLSNKQTQKCGVIFSSNKICQLFFQPHPLRYISSHNPAQNPTHFSLDYFIFKTISLVRNLSTMASNAVSCASAYLSGTASKAEEYGKKLLDFQREADQVIKHVNQNARLELTALRLQTVAADLKLLAYEARDLERTHPQCLCYKCTPPPAKQVILIPLVNFNSIF